jgi:hypothetical protein
LNEQGNDTVCVKNGNATKRHVVIFDSKCGFCRASVHFFKKLDWLGKLEFVSLTDPRALAIAPGVTKEDFEKAVYCVSNDGKITSAARCFRFIAIRVPLLFPLGLSLWFPGMNDMGCGENLRMGRPSSIIVKSHFWNPRGDALDGKAHFNHG